MTSNFQLGLTLGETISTQDLETGFSSIEEHTQLLSKTIDDFRNFYAPNKSKNSFLLMNLLNQSVKLLASTLEEADVKIVHSCTIKREIFSYESEIFQVFINIIKNAIDILEEGTGAKEIIISTKEDEHFAYVMIEDSAGGIPKKIIDKVFDPYFSTKMDKNGTGLGLYMSKIIIEDHCGGKISVSNTSRGAKFLISFPFDSIK